MPQDVNLASPIAAFQPDVNSIRAWLYPDVEHQTVETTLALCGCVHMQSFSGNNQTGSILLEGFLDTGLVPIMTFYNVSTFTQLLQKVFS